MAVCMDEVLENALAEQNDELVALESIYGDNFNPTRWRTQQQQQQAT